VALARVAGRQLGVVSRAQLGALGFTKAQVERRVAQGRLHPLFHHVYAVGHRRVIDRAHLLAALLSLGPSAFLSHRTAAAVWGLRAVNLHDIELTVPGTGGRRRPGLTVHRCLRTEDHKSELELAFDRMLAEHLDIPAPRRNIHIDVWELDRFWPQHKLAVELDGRPYHIAVADMERDRLKDTALQRLGLTPLRFTDFRVEHDPRGILRDLRHFLNLSPPEPPAL
jgi:very-short-patch-repair endonuclease